MRKIRQISLFFSVTLLSMVPAVLADDGDPASSASLYLPAYFLEVPDTVRDLLVAVADSATMYRFTHAGDRITEKDQRYMSIGQNGIGKEKAWDKKTPLGVYFITERLDTSKLHDKYGVAAFPLDYPNAWDRHNHRTGDGIWLHGVDHNNPERPPLDTDGCLSLPNEELLLLAEDLHPLVTPVIVAREMKWATPAELQAMRLEFRLALDIWRQAQEQGDLHAYLSLYSDDFTYRDMNKKEWSSWRMNELEASPLEAIEISNLMLMADPEVDDLYLSRFTQVLSTKNGPVRMTKRLYWRRSENNTWRIVAEGSG